LRDQPAPVVADHELVAAIVDGPAGGQGERRGERAVCSVVLVPPALAVEGAARAALVDQVDLALATGPREEAADQGAGGARGRVALGAGGGCAKRCGAGGPGALAGCRQEARSSRPGGCARWGG